MVKMLAKPKLAKLRLVNPKSAAMCTSGKVSEFEGHPVPSYKKNSTNLRYGSSLQYLWQSGVQLSKET